jgi:probable rRNA maturation factor
MILLDPDLDPDPAAKATSAKRKSAPAKKKKSFVPKSSEPKSTEIALPSAQTLARFLKLAQMAVGLKGQVTVLLTTDEAIRGLNRRFRGKNKATDVLSFPVDRPNQGSDADRAAGDIAISVTTALCQAHEQGHPLWTEIKVLILHGLLHLAGFDHETDNGKMARRELLLRARLRLPEGLIERVSTPETLALKGHGFSRAAKNPNESTTLAAEGMQARRKARAKALKPPPFKGLDGRVSPVSPLSPGKAGTPTPSSSSRGARP